MNDISFTGNLGQDPELREHDGQSVTNLNVAVNKRFTRKTSEGDVKDTITIWYDVAVWGAQAEACVKYLKSGRQVLVQGELIADPETGGPRLFDRTNGEKGAKFEVRARRVEFLGRA